MLNIEVNMKEHLFKVEAAGSTSAIAAEMAAACGLIYAKLKAADHTAAEEFRSKLMRSLAPGAPAWAPPPMMALGTIMVIPHKGDGWSL